MTPETLYTAVGLAIFAYLFGSIPFGLVLTRLFTSVDILREGSGNIGATNVRRLAGTPLGFLTLTGDVLKGALPVYLAQMVTAPPIMAQEVTVSVVVLAAFFGHLYPLYMKLKNGAKGVATAMGGLVVISPTAVLVALAAFLLAAGLSNRASAGSLTAAATLPPAFWWATRVPVFSVCALIMALWIYARHRDNIKRLLNGTEPQIRSKSANR
jgi:glycerol-3-phosphate acyltransferase PlsY